MTSMSDIQEVVDTIAQEFKPQKVILFGSYARGDEEPDSDVDLLVIMPHEEHASRKAAEITCRVHPRRFALDLIVRSPEVVRHRLALNDWFMRELMREGRILYAA